MAIRLTKDFRLFASEDPLTIDIDNDTDAIAVDNDNNLREQVSRETNVSLYYGTTKQSISTLSAKVYKDAALTQELPSSTTECNAETGNVRVNIPAGNIPDSLYVNISASCGYGSRDIVFTIIPQVAGKAGETPVIYLLAPSETSLPFDRTDAGTLAERTYEVALNVKRTEGNNSTIISELSGYKCYVGFDAVDYENPIAIGQSVTVNNSNIGSHTSLCIELWKGVYGTEGAKLQDRETLPIIKDGKAGEPGDPGDEGNGIASVTTHRKYTPTLTPPTANESGWIASTADDYPSTPVFSDISHYLWEKRTTTYTKSSSVDVQIVLVAASDTKEIRPQLLTGTSFDSEETMTDWVRLNGAVVPEALRGQNAWGFLPNAAAKQYDLLRQMVYKPGDICKIQPNQWYTLSFYARDRKMVNEQSNEYGFAAHSVYLMPGTYRLEFNGRCTEAARSATMPVALHGYLFNNSWSNLVDKSIITTEDITVKSSVLTVSTAELYTISFYAYKDAGTPGDIGEEVRVNWFRVICESRKDSSGTAVTGAHNALATYLYPSALDNTGVCYMDGTVITTLPADGCVYWHLDNDTPDSDGWTRHWVSFKTKSQISPVEQAILFRGYGAYIEIAAVKLERGVIPTAWCEHNYDSHTECSHNPCGKWRAGTTYYYCNGQRDVVRAKFSAGGGDTWWRMKRRTAHTGYISNTEPYADTEHWERGNNLKFSIVDAMFAEEVFTDKLTVSKIQGANGKFSLDADGNVTGKDCLFENGEFQGIIKASLVYQKFFSFGDEIDVLKGDVAYVGFDWTGGSTILPQAKTLVGKVIRIINKHGHYSTSRSYMGESPIYIGQSTFTDPYGNTYTHLDVNEMSIPDIAITNNPYKKAAFCIKSGFRDGWYFPPNILELLATETGWVVLNCRGYCLFAQDYNDTWAKVMDFDDNEGCDSSYN